MPDIQYFPNIIEYKASLKGYGFDISGLRPYPKASFRNRCIIAAAEGPLTLSIPIRGGRGVRLPYQEVQICEKADWRTRHWRTIASAYGRAPWFFQYAESLQALYTKKVSKLIDWNLACLQWVDQALGWSAINRLDKDGTPISIERDLVSPQNYFEPKLGPFPKYGQVFEEKTGFHPNLSILDFVLCAGRPGRHLLGI